MVLFRYVFVICGTFSRQIEGVCMYCVHTYVCMLTLGKPWCSESAEGSRIAGGVVWLVITKFDSWNQPRWRTWPAFGALYLETPALTQFLPPKNLIFTTNANGNLMLYGYGIHTFLYICQMSWYWMGKMTKRRGFSRKSGSSEGSKGVTDFSTSELADFPTPFSAWPFDSWPMDILRTLLALSVRIFLLGLCLQEKRRNATKTSIFFRCVVLFPSGNPHIHPSRYYVYV